MSRSPDRTELLRGPLIYCLVIMAVTVFSWRSGLTGMVIIAMMCGGDGFADLIGRRLGTAKLPWSPGKSWAGSGAMFVGGITLGCGLIAYFNALGFTAVSALEATPLVAVVAVVCTLVESIPAHRIDDNISVPLAAAILGSMLEPSVRGLAAVAEMAFH